MTLLDSTSLFSHDTIKSELSKCQEMLRKSKGPNVVLSQNKESYSYLEKISSLEDTIVEIAKNANQKAVDLKDQLDGALKISTSIQQCWSWLQQTTEMAQLHMKNAATFHNFHANACELKTSLKNIGLSPENMRVDSSPKTILYEIERKFSLCRERLSQYSQLWQKSEWLVSNCYSVIPIYMRRDKLRQATKVICLCNYQTVGTKIEVDDTILLLDNSDSTSWKVKTKGGDEIRIPSIACLIPGPDQKSVEMAYNLRDSLCEKWKNDLVQIQFMIIDLLKNICQEIIENKLHVHPDCSNKLRTTLACAEEDICFERDGRRQKDLSELLNRLYVHLDRVSKQPTGHSNETMITMSDVSNIRGLIAAFKDHVKNCQQLVHQLDRGRPRNCPNIALRDGTNKTDVEKLFHQLPSNGNDSRSPHNDSFDDYMPSTPKPKCVSRLYWNLSSYDTIEKSVNTAELTKDSCMSVYFENEYDSKKYYTSKKIMLTPFKDRSKGGMENYSVRYFEVNKSFPSACVDEFVAYTKPVSPSSIQTDPSLESGIGFQMDPTKNTRMFRSPPSLKKDPPGRTERCADTAISWCQTDTSIFKDMLIQTDPSFESDINIEIGQTRTKRMFAAPPISKKDTAISWCQTDTTIFKDMLIQTDHSFESDINIEIEQTRTKRMFAAPPISKTDTATSWCQTDTAKLKDIPIQTNPWQGIDMETQTQTAYSLNMHIQTDKIRNNTSFTQTDVTEVADASIVYCQDRGNFQSQTATKTESTKPTQTDRVEKPTNHKYGQTEKTDMINQGTEPSKARLVDSLVEGPRAVMKNDGKTQTEIRTFDRGIDTMPKYTRELSLQTDDPIRMDKSLMMSGIERRARVTQTMEPKLMNCQVQTQFTKVKDSDSHRVTNFLTHDTQTSSEAFAKKYDTVGIQTGDLSYEVITRVLIEGEEAKELEVMSVTRKFAERH